MIELFCRIAKFAPSLQVYDAIVIAGKVFAVGPPLTDLPHNASPALTSHSLGAERVTLHRADRFAYREASIVGKMTKTMTIKDNSASSQTPR